MSGGMGSGRGGHMFGGDDTGPTKPAGAALPLLRRAAKFFGPYRGRHEELRAKGGLYAELAAVQFGLHA